MKRYGQMAVLTVLFILSGIGVFQMVKYQPSKLNKGRFPASKSKIAMTSSTMLHPEFFDEIEEHYEVFDKYANGTHMCHHFELENKPKGMRIFLIQLSNFINGRCLAESISINGPFELYSQSNRKYFLVCCDKVDSPDAIPHFRFERSQDLKQKQLKQLHRLLESR
jgi:hypothetical protein